MTVIASLRWRENVAQFSLAAPIVMALLLAVPAAEAAKGELKPVKGAIIASDFMAQDLQGRPARFSELRGDVQDAQVPRAQGRAGAAKVVLLNFWATWCPPCRKEMPTMEQLYRTYKERGLVVLAVSQDQAPLSEVRSFAEELKLSFPVWHDRDGLIGRQYSVPGVPTSYLIDAKRRMTHRVIGEYDWFSDVARAVVEQLLGAEASPAGEKK